MEAVKILRSKKGLPEGVKVIDAMPSALRELFIVRNPRVKLAQKNEQERAFAAFARKVKIRSVFAYYPWLGCVVRIPEEEVYFELRTARNKNIITKKEQEQYRHISAGIIGLSVGANVLSALALGGGPKYLRIADYDIIEISNLNRLRAPASALGINKAVFAAQETWGIDPFAQIDVWPNGVERNTLKTFFTKKPRLSIFVDEMDDLELKIRSRLLARTLRMPVVMATDNGDSVILDVERFDLEPQRKILHGLVEGIDPDRLRSLPYAEWLKIATRIVDPKNLAPRVRASLPKIGKTLAGVPQLGTTATLAGVAAAYVIRKIATREPLPSGRYFISLDAIGKK